MPIKGFGGSGTFTNSKASKKVMHDSSGKGMLSGGNSSKSGVGLKSNSKHTTNPTEGQKGYAVSNKGGASGDGSTPGYSGSGTGVNELNGAHSNDALRGLAY